MNIKKSLQIMRQPSLADAQYSSVEAFKQAVLVSEEAYALTSNPIKWTQSGHFLAAVLLSKLGLDSVEKIREQENAPKFVYTLHLPSVKEGIAWREAALFWMTTHNKETLQHSQTRLLACEEQQRLRLFKTIPYACAVPIMVVNPRDHRIRGFNPFPAHERPSLPIVAQADPISMERWKINVFIPLEMSFVPRWPIPCTF